MSIDLEKCCFKIQKEENQYFWKFLGPPPQRKLLGKSATFDDRQMCLETLSHFMLKKAYEHRVPTIFDENGNRIQFSNLVQD